MIVSKMASRGQKLPTWTGYMNVCQNSLQVIGKEQPQVQQRIEYSLFPPKDDISHQAQENDKKGRFNALDHKKSLGAQSKEKKRKENPKKEGGNANQKKNIKAGRERKANARTKTS